MRCSKNLWLTLDHSLIYGRARASVQCLISSWTINFPELSSAQVRLKAAQTLWDRMRRLWTQVMCCHSKGTGFSHISVSETWGFYLLSCGTQASFSLEGSCIDKHFLRQMQVRFWVSTSCIQIGCTWLVLATDYQQKPYRSSVHWGAQTWMSFPFLLSPCARRMLKMRGRWNHRSKEH